MAQVPHDLIVEILVRLPVKPLLRFRRLSKASCEVIDSPDFAKSHLSKSSKNFNLRKLILLDQITHRFDVCDPNLNLEQEILPDSSLLGTVSGNCNGLLLLYNSLGFSVYNPSTRHRRYLPYCPFVGIIGSGLGYDDSVDDYKAVVCFFDLKVLVPQVWVCGLKSNIWRRVHNFPAILAGLGCFSYGYLYWVCNNPAREIRENESGFEVIAFNVSSEKFRLVPQPILSKSGPELHVLEGCLCISYLDSCMLPRAADIYVMMMKKDGVDTFTWTQLHSVEKPFKTVDASEHSKGGDKILLIIRQGCVLSYDLKKKSFLKVEMNKDCSWTASILCLESLVR